MLNLGQYGISLSITAAVGILAIIWAVRSPYMTVRWRGAGKRVMWFSLLMLLPIITVETVGMKLPDLLALAGIEGLDTLADGSLYHLLLCIVFVAATEEGGKFLAIVCGTAGFRRVRSRLDLVGYALISAGALTVVENVMYLASYRFSSSIAISRAIFSSPLHILCAVLPALGKLRAKESGKQKYFWLHFLQAILIHGFFDYILLYFVGKLDSTVFAIVLLLLSPLVFLSLLFFLLNILRAPKRYAQQNSSTFCRTCGHTAPGFFQQCPACQSPETVTVEQIEAW